MQRMQFYTKINIFSSKDVEPSLQHFIIQKGHIHKRISYQLVYFYRSVCDIIN